MKKILIILFSFCFSYNLLGQNFPKDFIGTWEGELLWYKKDGTAPQNVKMKLEILPTDTANQYSWSLTYGDKKTDHRPYLLKQVDSVKGHWVIDEKNGIILDQYWLGNRLTGAFTVLSSTIINTYYLRKKKMIVEFYSISTKPVTTTGGNSAEIPEVKSYEMKNYQKAVLKRKKK